MKLFIELKQSSEFVRERDKSDRWDAGEQRYYLEDVLVSTTSFSKYLSSWSEEFDTDIDFNPGDICYVVIVQYSTGSTFGQEYGLSTIIDVFDNARKAFDLTETIKNIYGPLRRSDKYNFIHNEKEYYAGRWVGYFERFEDVIVRPVIVT